MDVFIAWFAKGQMWISGIAVALGGMVWAYGGLVNMMAVGREAETRRAKEIIQHVLKGLMIIGIGPWLIPLVWSLIKLFFN